VAVDHGGQNVKRHEARNRAGGLPFLANPTQSLRTASLDTPPPFLVSLRVRRLHREVPVAREFQMVQEMGIDATTRAAVLYLL